MRSKPIKIRIKQPRLKVNSKMIYKIKYQTITNIKDNNYNKSNKMEIIYKKVKIYNKTKNKYKENKLKIIQCNKQIIKKKIRLVNRDNKRMT